MFFAYLLDKNVSGTRLYQSVYYFPVVLSLAVVGFMWKCVMFSRDSGLLNILWPGEPDRLRRRPDEDLRDPTAVPRLPARAVEELRRPARRHGVAAHRLHHGALPGRTEGVDPSLREAAAIDGCNEWQASGPSSFRR